MKKRHVLIYIMALCLSVLMLLAVLPARAEETESEAEDITKDFTFTKNNKSQTSALYSHDGKYVTYNTLERKDVLSIRPKGDRQMSMLYFRMGSENAHMILRQYSSSGAEILSSDLNVDTICYAVKLEANCCSVEIAAKDEPFRICEVSVLSRGRFPDSLPMPGPSVERTDILIVTTHPDDEWIFLGAVYPIYVQERGYTGTFAYVTTPSMGRVHEAINSVWTANMRTMPYFLGFPDVSGSQPKSKKDTFKAEAVTLALVRLYRKIKPLVVVSQDPDNGEYGHWQHIISARCALEAATLAQDSAYDPESAEEYGVWTVKKVYQHLAEKGRIMLDAYSPLSAYNGMSAFEVAQRAFSEHKSQQKYSYRPTKKTSGMYDMRRFGLTFTSVGQDTDSDMFEHIEENDLAEVILNATPTPSPTPEPTPTPTPTPEPTPTPTPTPIPTPTPTPEPTPTPVPTATPAPTSAAMPEATPSLFPGSSVQKTVISWVLYAGAAAVLVLCAAMFIALRRRRIK